MRTQAPQLNITSTIAALAAVGAATFLLATVTSSVTLWSTSTSVVVASKPAVLTLRTSEYGSRLQRTALNAAANTVEQLSEDSPLQEQTRSTVRLASVLSVIGLISAALVRKFHAARPTVLHPLDVDGSQPLMMASAAGEGEQTYHFLVANSRFMLFDEEHAMELLREKRRYQREKGIPADFWLVPNPEFLDQFPDIDQRVRKPCCALVSTDEMWITFMKTRLDKVLRGSFKASADVTKALATKGGDPLKAVPKFELPEGWTENVPYPHYSEDWFHPFLVGAQ